MAKRIAWLRKKIIGNLSSTLYFEKTKKKLRFLSEGSLNLSLRDVIRLKQKMAFPDSEIYLPDIKHRTL